MTKSQIVFHFAGKFELTKKTASGIIDELAALAVSETKKTGSILYPSWNWETGSGQKKSSYGPQSGYGRATEDSCQDCGEDAGGEGR